MSPVHTFQSIDIKRLEYSTLTKEDLDGRTIKQLRNMAAEVSTGRIVRNEKTIPISSARKDELVNAIWLACDDKRKISQLATELTTEQIEKIAQVAKETNDLYQTDEGSLAEKVWKELREYTISLWDADKQMWRMHDGRLNNIVFSLANNLNSRGLHPETVLNKKTHVLKTIRPMLELEANTASYQQLKDVFELFSKMLHQSYTAVAKAKHKRLADVLNERKDSVCEVEVFELYQWARRVLSQDFSVLKKTAWLDITIALMLVTGRRQSEILATASFEQIDGRSDVVNFSGQLKTKEPEGRFKVFEIPVLASPSQVVAALDWLTGMGKREQDPAKAHKRFSKEVGGHCKIVNQYLKVVFVPEGKDSIYLKGHLCRQIYAQVCGEVLTPRGMKLHNYISDILGHGATDNHTSDNYDADIKVLDAARTHISPDC